MTHLVYSYNLDYLLYYFVFSPVLISAIGFWPGSDNAESDKRLSARSGQASARESDMLSLFRAVSFFYILASSLVDLIERVGRWADFIYPNVDRIELRCRYG